MIQPTPLEVLLNDLQHKLADEMILEAEAKRKAAKEMYEKAKLERVQAEEMLAEYRHSIALNQTNRRPSRDRYVEIEYHADQKLWSATHQGVTAYGDTPEMACDNFDQLWVYGYGD